MKKEKKTRNYFFYDFVMVTAAIPGLIFFRPKVIFENDIAKKKIKGGALVVCNHSGNVDPIILMFAINYRRHHFVATKELFDKKVKNFLFTRFHCLEIDRDDMSLSSFREIIDTIHRGKVVSMFPEGHITEVEEVQKFKSGAVFMAITARAPIIPVYIQKRTSVWHRQKIVIGEPINPAELLNKIPSMADMENMTEMLRERESKLKEIADNLCKKKK